MSAEFRVRGGAPDPSVIVKGIRIRLTWRGIQIDTSGMRFAVAGREYTADELAVVVLRGTSRPVPPVLPSAEGPA